jgi:hypothetical protein
LAEALTFWEMEEFVSGGIWFPGGALGVDYKSINLVFWISRQKEKTDASSIRFERNSDKQLKLARLDSLINNPA